MKIYWNTDARQITFDIESGISAPRYSKLPLELFFQKGTYPNNLDSYLLPEDTVIHAVLKLEGSYNTNTALAAIIGAGFETPELVANPYTGDLNLNTVSIDSLFRQLDNTEEVKCTLVILYRPADVGDWVVSPQIPFTLENAVATGYEGSPSPIPQGVSWGEITGTLSNQTDLNNALNARVLTSITITGSGLATGGGDGTADRVIDVPIASQAEAEAGTVTDKAMTPQRTAQAIAAIVGPNPNFAGRKVVYVSKGSAATDTRTGLSQYDYLKPFASLSAAQTAASSGDTIIVEPGSYTGVSLGKNGVNWHFITGSEVTTTGTGSIWADGGNVMAYEVTGDGVFRHAGTLAGQVVYLTAASTVTMRCRLASTAGSAAHVLRGTAGTLIFHGEIAVNNTAGNSSALLATGASSLTQRVYGNISSKSTAAAARCEGASVVQNIYGSITHTGSGTGGAAANNVLGAFCSDGSQEIHGDIITTGAAISSTGGSQVVVGNMTTSSTTLSAVYHSGTGVQRISGRITGLASNFPPAYGTGSGMILDGVTLIAGASAGSSLESASSMNVTVYQAVANKAVHVSITQLVGSVVVDSNVQ